MQLDLKEESPCVSSPSYSNIYIYIYIYTYIDVIWNKLCDCGDMFRQFQSISKQLSLSSQANNHRLGVEEALSL